MSINHIKVLNFVAVMAIMLGACTQQPIYFGDSLKVYDSDEVDHSDELAGVPVISEAIGAYSLNVVDTVICLANSKIDAKFSLFNLGGDSIVSVGTFGNGPSDFTSNRMNRQNVVTADNASMWVIDPNAAALKRLNLTRSIKEGKSCVDSIISIQPMVKNAFLTGDTLIQECFSNGNYDISLSTIDGKSLSQEPIYKQTVDPSELFTFYDGTMGVSPDGHNLVIAMLAINQINIFDLQNGQRNAVSVGGVKGPDYILDRQTMLPVWTYYSNLSLGNKYIYALYENQPYSVGDNENKKSALHVFDYNGGLIRIIPLDRFLYSISYSDSDNSIYGLDDNETVWRYDLSSAGL